MPGTMPVTLDPRVYRATAQEKPRCRSVFRLQVPKSCNMALDTCTRSEGMAHKITQADKTQRMGTRTKSLRTMSTTMPNSFGRIRGTCCARNACRPTSALGASWLRRRQTSRQYLTPPDFTIAQAKGIDINPDPCHRSSSQPALHRSAPRPVARPRSRSGLGCDPAPRWRRQSASGAPAGHLRGGRGDLGPWYL